jgi:hypothetical protein
MGNHLLVPDFDEDDGSYERWIAVNQDQFVINAERSRNPRALVLHRADCDTINGTPGRGRTWIGDYVKICGRRDELLGRYPTSHPCGLCLP